MIARLRAIVGKPAFVYLCAYTLARAAQFLLIPLYTSRLTTVEYGDYALGQTLMSMFPGVMSLGVHGAVSRFYFDEKDVARGQFQAGSVARWHLFLVLASALLMEAAVLAFWPDHTFAMGGKREVSFLVVACAGSSISIIPGSYLRTRQRAIAAASLLVIEFAAVITSGILLVRVFDRGLRGAFEAYGVAYGLMGTVGTVFILSLPGRMSLDVLKRALPFSLPLVPHLLANQLQNVADRWTLKVSGLHAQLGPYALAAQLTSPVSMVMAAYHDGATPQMGETFREGGLRAVEAGIAAVRRRYLLVAAAGGALVLLGLPIAKLVVPSDYRAAFWISPLLCGVFLIESFYYSSVNVVYYASRTRAIPRVTLSAAALNVGLNLVCIRYMGVGGAVVARGISMTYRSLGMWLAARAAFNAPTLATAEIAAHDR
jgi:O-antigen/teichoic acid export membrane protein